MHPPSLPYTPFAADPMIGLTARPRAGGPCDIAVMIGQLAQGGSERQLYLFLAHCDRTRWAPVLYVSGELGLWEGPIRDLGIPIVLLRGNPLAKLLQFARAVRRGRPACFFSWSSYTNAYGLALLGTATRRIGSHRNALFADLPERLRGFWSWSSVAAVSVGVCNSPETCEALAAAAPRRAAAYVPNAVEMPAAAQVRTWREAWRARLGIAPGTVLVAGIGRLAPQKCFTRFLDVVAAIDPALPVRAVIAGEDRGCLADLERHAARLGLSERVRFLGAVPRAQELVCAADIFLLTSDFEGMPNVVLEAMAASVPCVVTRVNGIGDLIRDGQSGFVAERDASALAACVTRLCADPGLRASVGQRARRAVERRHDPARVAAELWTLCERPAR